MPIMKVCSLVFVIQLLLRKMVVNNINKLVIKMLLIAINTAMCYVQIDEVIVPESVSVDSKDTDIECIYSGLTEDFTVRWMFNGKQFFEWTSGMEPSVYEIFNERVVISTITNKIQALKLTNLSSDLSGQYTCVIYSHGREARQTKSMLVYSTERDFQLICKRGKLKCIAVGVYPQPHLTIEINKVPIAQEQRIWRNGSLFDAECIAKITTVITKYGEISCRLQIPQVEYTAIIKKNIGYEQNTADRISVSTTVSAIFIVLHYFIMTVLI